MIIFFPLGSIDTPLPEGNVTSAEYAPQAEDGTYIFSYDSMVRYTGDQTLQVDENSTFGSQSAILDADNPRFSHEEVAIELSPLFLEEETAAVEMTKMLAPLPSGITGSKLYLTMQNLPNSFTICSMPSLTAIPISSGMIMIITIFTSQRR